MIEEIESVSSKSLKYIHESSPNWEAFPAPKSYFLSCPKGILKTGTFTFPLKEDTPL